MELRYVEALCSREMPRYGYVPELEQVDQPTADDAAPDGLFSEARTFIEYYLGDPPHRPYQPTFLPDGLDYAALDPIYASAVGSE